jgi:hypothetical protein
VRQDEANSRFSQFCEKHLKSQFVASSRLSAIYIGSTVGDKADRSVTGNSHLLVTKELQYVASVFRCKVLHACDNMP